MTDPFADDGWDELTRELGVEKAPPAAEPFDDEAPPEPVEEDPALAAGDEFSEGLEAEGDAPDGAEAPGDGPQEPGKKRRRRRRRRKKGPGEGEAVENAAEAEAAPAAEGGEYAESEYETGPGSDTDELTPVPVGAEEDTAGEALRDLIANWNVPSWDSIITGLYRPER
ncbi:MAG: hypothetical protein U0791_18800 [Gemmataceae bacterium]